MTELQSIAARYTFELYNTYGTLLAVFDRWNKLAIGHRLNDVSTYTIEFMDTDDPRFNMFALDGIVKVFREVPGCGLARYMEFSGFHRKVEKTVSDTGERIFISSGVDFNDLLRRRIINYLQGTVRADKVNIPADTAMTEYVEENCGPTSQNYTIVGRMTNGYFSGFSVAPSAGTGINYTNTNNSFRNLLDVLKEIAEFSRIDFRVNLVEPDDFRFSTYPDGLGENRTVDEVVPLQGINTYRNVPVVFSVEFGNILNVDYKFDRISEDNVVSVLGPGTGSERIVYAFSDTGTTDDSRWNTHEFSTTGGDFEYYYQYKALAEEQLALHKKVKEITFSPMQQPSLLYGLHYSFGDKTTVVFENTSINVQLREANIEVNSDGGEGISLTFTNVNVPTE